jgi:hypothetical protein
MPQNSWPTVFWCFSLAVASLLVATTARAQVPALLLGQWEMRQISFIANQTVPPDIQERMDNPEVAELNQEVAAGVAHLLVEFRPDGTYHFTVKRPGQPDRVEAGTYAVRAHLGRFLFQPATPHAGEPAPARG